MYSGKHARPGGTGSRRGACGPGSRTAIPRQAGEADDATSLNEVSLDDLEAEDALDRSSHDDMQRLLGSIHVRGIRLQSPVRIGGSRRNSGEKRRESVPWRPGRRPDDTVPLVKCDTIPLVRL